jgi:hypothetical protein
VGPNRGMSTVMLQDVCAVPTRERSTEIISLRSREAGGTWAVSSTYLYVLREHFQLLKT